MLYFSEYLDREKEKLEEKIRQLRTEEGHKQGNVSELKRQIQLLQSNLASSQGETTSLTESLNDLKLKAVPNSNLHVTLIQEDQRKAEIVSYKKKIRDRQEVLRRASRYQQYLSRELESLNQRLEEVCLI